MIKRSKKHWTGERLETYIFNENTIEHLHRYAIAIEHTTNKIVLDIACGEGYGSNLLAEKANYVYGVDISEETVIEAKEKYIKPNLEFKSGSTSSIPLEDNSIDVVVSFETIEHHKEHEQMMLEIKRVLKPTGMLIISSPDKRTYTDVSGNNNPHHVKELYFKELDSLLNRYFLNTRHHFQKMIHGSILYQKDAEAKYKEYVGSYDYLLQQIEENHIYIISLASDLDVPYLETSTFGSKEIDEIKAQENQLDVDKAIERITSSWSYKIGNSLLRPFSFLKKIVNG